MVSCISIGSVFADVALETFDLWVVKAVWNNKDQTLHINGDGKIDKAKWEQLKVKLALTEYSASNVIITFTDGAKFPDDASSFFDSVKGEIRFPTASIDVSNVTNMSNMFAGADKFNQPLDKWDTSNVINMSGMFHWAESFNQSLNNWNVGNVTNMSNMFAGAVKFNQPLDKWNVSNVKDMSRMFGEAVSFNQPLNNWNVSNVKDLSWMFYMSYEFNQSLNNWNVGNVTDMSWMFANAYEFNQPLDKWNVSNVKDMSRMFGEAVSFNQPLNNWNVSNVTNMRYMFRWAYTFNQPLNNWNVSNVTNMNFMFGEASLFNQPLDKWNVSNVKDMSGMFRWAFAFNQPLNNWNVSNVTDMEAMFLAAYEFNQPLDKWNVSNVKDMSGMFKSASAFDQDISSWDPKSLKEGDQFIKDSGFSMENNNKLLKWWNEKLWSKPNKVTVEIDVPYCEGEQALESLKNKNYDIVLEGNGNCDVKTYFLTKWKDKNLPITFDIDWNLESINEQSNFPQDFGLKITKEKITDNKTKITISGVPQTEWKYRVIFKASDQQNKFRKEITLIVKKHKLQGNTIITPNTNEKPNDNWAKNIPNDNWAKDTPKQETPVVDKYTRPLKKIPLKPESLGGKKVFSDDEIFNPTIVNGQCYTRRPYLWIKDSDTIITDEEFRKALSFLRTYEMTMFDSVDGYRPYRNLSRQEAAKMFSNFAINVLCRKPDLNLKVNYSDVEDADPTLKPYITLAYQLGVMKGSGMGDGLFRPFDKITKAEVNAVLIRMILKSYLDETRSESKKWYSEYNKVATEFGIINRGAGSEHISRNNTALMLFRAYKQQVFEWRLIDYYSYVLQSRDLFVK